MPDIWCFRCVKPLDGRDKSHFSRKSAAVLFTPKTIKNVESATNMTKDKIYACLNCISDFKRLLIKKQTRTSRKVRYSTGGNKDDTVLLGKAGNSTPAVSTATQPETQASAASSSTETPQHKIKRRNVQATPDITTLTTTMTTDQAKTATQVTSTPRSQSIISVDTLAEQLAILRTPSQTTDLSDIPQLDTGSILTPADQPLARKRLTLTISPVPASSDTEQPALIASNSDSSDTEPAVPIASSSDSDAQGPVPRVNQKAKKLERCAGQVARYVLSSHYQQAASTLIQHSKRAKAKLTRRVATEAHNEIHRACMASRSRRVEMKSLTDVLEAEDMHKFSWGKVLKEARQKMPTTYRLLDALFPTNPPKQASKGKKGLRRKITRDEFKAKRDARMGMTLAIILHTKSPYVYKTFQALNSLFFYIEGATQQLKHYLHHIGLCQAKGAPERQVDKMRNGDNAKMLGWTKAVQGYLERQDGPHTRKSAATLMPRTSSFVFDNVQFLAERKHQVSGQPNKMILRTMRLGVLHRTDSLHLSDVPQLPSSLGAPDFLPKAEDRTLVQDMMVVVVSRILVTHIPYLRDYKKHVPSHVTHEYSQAMCQRSQIANLGTTPDDPGTTEGVISVLNGLLKYVPTITRGGAGNQEDKILTTKIDGDQLSCEKVMNARRATMRAVNPARRRSYRENAQEFHNDILQKNDTMKDLFHENTGRDVGTLYHIKQEFQLRNVKKKVMENVQHASDFLKFATDGYVIAMYLHHHTLDAMDTEPEDFPNMTQKERIRFIRRSAEAIVKGAWQDMTKSDVDQVVHGYRHPKDYAQTYEYCICGEDKTADMVRCENSKCAVSWYHLDCAPGYNPDDPGDYFCSAECTVSIYSNYCSCGFKVGLDGCTAYIECARGEDCFGKEKYHLTCVPDLDTGAGEFFCSDECKRTDDELDGKREYALQVVYRGLWHLAKHDFEREGNGKGLVAMWRLYTPMYWRGNHYKYLICMHNKMQAVNGIFGERLAHECTWENVANLKGLPGCNVALDLLCEHANNDFKERVRQLKGRYTEDSLQRISHMGSVFRKELSGVFKNSVGLLDSFEPVRKEPEGYLANVEALAKLLKAEDLFTNTPGRHFRGIPHYKRILTVHEPFKLGARLNKYTENSKFISEMNHRARVLVRRARNQPQREGEPDMEMNLSTSEEEAM